MINSLLYLYILWCSQIALHLLNLVILNIKFRKTFEGSVLQRGTITVILNMLNILKIRLSILYRNAKEDKEKQTNKQTNKTKQTRNQSKINLFPM